MTEHAMKLPNGDTIREGGYGCTRDGCKVGPMVRQKEGHGWAPCWIWTDQKNGIGNVHTLWRHDGTHNGLDNIASSKDIIAEWRNDTPAHIITHEGREYDLYTLETPPFFLPSPVVSALNVWSYGIEKLRWGAWEDADHVPPRSHIVYRAKPAPVEVRVECYRGVAGVGGKYGTCIKRADGSIDWATWRAEE